MENVPDYLTHPWYETELPFEHGAVRVIEDSVSPDGHRLTTLEGRLWRPLNGENNTHRRTCLAGDTLLHFRLPSTGASYKMRIDEFVQKWNVGAAPRPNKPRKNLDLTLIDPLGIYTPIDIRDIFGFESQTAFNLACRNSELVAQKVKSCWEFTGQAFVDYWCRPSTNRQTIQDRLSNMLIDQIEEDGLQIGAATVRDCWEAGTQTVYALKSGGKEIKASSNHQFFTPDGWKRLSELDTGDKVAVKRRGLPSEERKDPLRFRLIDGKWVSQWLRNIRPLVGPKCECGADVVDLHHIVPIHMDPSKAFEFSNIEGLCEECHQQRHAVQDWQTVIRNYIDFSVIDSITALGDEPTYDLEISGPWPNFLANDFVVHNSKNSASLRAIPPRRKDRKGTLDICEDHPAEPMFWGGQKPGMSPGEELTGTDLERAQEIWRSHRSMTIQMVEELTEIGLHKSVANRLLEPHLWQTIVMSATNWGNYFALRSTRFTDAAQPEMAAFADGVLLALEHSTPVGRRWDSDEQDNWHLPYVMPHERVELSIEDLKACSSARTCRVSRLNQDNTDPTIQRDIETCDGLRSMRPMHASPFEHVAVPSLPGEPTRCNFDGWWQWRHMLEDEYKIDSMA